MGTGQTSRNTETTSVKVSSKPPRCSICHKVITPDCEWKQGRCPHLPSLVDQILANPYKSRFYNLINFFKGKNEPFKC